MHTYNTDRGKLLFYIVVFTIASVILIYTTRTNEAIQELEAENQALITHIKCLQQLDSLHHEKIILEKRISDTIEKRSKIVEEDLINAMIQVESEGDSSAYCASEQAVGCLQIRPIMLREVNRILKIREQDKRFTLQDRWSRGKSVEMFYVWKNFHHKDSSPEKIARNWNGGPRGINNPRTVRYWNKVENEIEETYALR